MAPKRTAQQAYDEHTAAALAKLEAIKAELERRARCQGANWAHVGSMTEVDNKLTDLNDMLHNTGEYAE